MANVEVKLQLQELDNTAGIQVGESFEVKISLVDIQNPNQPKSVFSGGLDLLFDPQIVQVNSITYDPDFSANSQVAIDPITGIVDELGATLNGLSAINDPTVVTLNLTAIKGGNTTITSRAGDTTNTEIAIFGVDGDQRSNTTFGSLDLTINPSPNSIPTLAITPTNATQNEGNSGTTAFTFTATRSGDTTSTSSINFAVTGSGDNPADAADFGGTLPLPGTVAFAAGETSQVITVNVSGDTTVESNEGFTVTLSNPTNATITTATAVGTIINDDVVANTAPVAVNDSFTTPQNTPLTKTIAELVSNDTDANGDALYISGLSLTSTQGGTLSADNNGTPDNPFDDKGTYTPLTGFAGTDTFSYTVNDGKGGTSIGTVTVNVLPPANVSPIAVNDTFTTPQNTPLTKTVAELVSNDTDANGDTLYISGLSITSTQGGTLSFDNNGTPDNPFDDKGTYTPPTGFAGTDTFNYTVNDGKGGTSIGTVNVNVVAAINNAPTLGNPLLDQTVKVNSTFTFTLPQNTFSDPDAVNPYKNLVIFGDSLSDTGNAYKASGNTFPAPPNYQGRASNGLIWVDYFAPDLQFTNQSIQNYAFFGANTGVSNTFGQTTVPGLLTQIQQFQTLNTNSIGKDGLYVIWAGANDFLNLATDPTQAVTNAVTNISSAIATLAELGAKEIVVGNLTDLGSLPGSIANNNVANARAISIGFNTALNQALTNLEPALNVDLSLVDIFGLSTAVQTNPANYKFTNITQPLITATNPVNPDQYAFWDDVHPTTRLHQLVTDTFENTLLNDGVIPDLIKYSATLADGSNLPDWLNFNSTTRTFNGTPKTGNVGKLDVKVIATDKAGATVNDIFTLAIENVNNAPTLVNTIADQNAKQGTAFNFQVPTNTFTDIDAGDVLTYSATLENGNALPTWLTFNSANQTFSGTPTNDNVGNLNVKVAATDKAGANVNDIFVIAVENINDAPIVANLIADQNAKQGTAFNFQVPTNTFADIDAGDVLTYSATLENGNALPTWLTFNSTTQTFSGTPTNDNVGNVNVKVAATDKAGASVNDIFVIAVEKIIDNKPTIVGTPGDDKLIATPGSQFNGENNIVFTGAGKDEVELSTVSVLPNSGNNIVDLGSGDDTIFVNKGDRAFGSDGNDTFEARDGQGNNRMSGGAGNDTFFLGSNDRALGGDGNDIFRVGLGGGNLISGGAGADQFWIVNAELPKAANTILDFQLGTDVIGLQADVSLGITTSTLQLNQVGADTAIIFNNQTLATLTGIQASSLSLTDPKQFVFA